MIFGRIFFQPVSVDLNYHIFEYTYSYTYTSKGFAFRDELDLAEMVFNKKH